MGREPRRARDDGWVAGPARDLPIAILDEDRDLAGGDLRSRDADGIDSAGPDVAADVLPRDRTDHESFERLGVEQPVEAFGRFTAADLLGDPTQAEQPARDSKQVAGRERQYLVDLHRLPQLDEPGAALVVFVCGRREVAGVDCADRGATDDVDVDRAAEPARQLVGQIANDTRFVCASRTTARQHHRTPG